MRCREIQKNERKSRGILSEADQSKTECLTGLGEGQEGSGEGEFGEDKEYFGEAKLSFVL